MGTFQVYFPRPPSGLFGPGNCTLRVIWDGHNTPGYFSGQPYGLFGPGNSTSTLQVILDVHPLGCTLRVIRAGLMHPPGYCGRQAAFRLKGKSNFLRLGVPPPTQRIYVGVPSICHRVKETFKSSSARFPIT